MNTNSSSSRNDCQISFSDSFFSTTGKVWKIAPGDTQCGTATLLADANVHLEGVVTVNNDAKWGGMKGAILAGAENEVRYLLCAIINSMVGQTLRYLPRWKHAMVDSWMQD